MLYDIWIILITIKYMAKKSQIKKKKKKKKKNEKVPWKVGLWQCYTVTQGMATSYPLALVEIVEKILTSH